MRKILLTILLAVVIVSPVVAETASKRPDWYRETDAPFIEHNNRIWIHWINHDDGCLADTIDLLGMSGSSALNDSVTTGYWWQGKD